MSILKIFAVYDVKSHIFEHVTFSVATGKALRDFITAANDPKSKLNLYPDEYEFYELGCFSEEKGTFYNYPADNPDDSGNIRKSLGFAKDFINKKED